MSFWTPKYLTKVEIVIADRSVPLPCLPCKCRAYRVSAVPTVQVPCKYRAYRASTVQHGTARHGRARLFTCARAEGNTSGWVRNHFQAKRTETRCELRRHGPRTNVYLPFPLPWFHADSWPFTNQGSSHRQIHSWKRVPVSLILLIP
jgi:hypothetical protein